MSALDPNRGKRVGISIGAVALANSAVFLSLGSSRLFKYGSEHIFGFEARTWGFVLLALAIVGVAAGIAFLVSAQKPRA